MSDEVLWYQVHGNLVLLTAYLADHQWTAQDVAYAVEKPWKYENEWAAAQKWGHDPDGNDRTIPS